jgi:menaquinone-dependent protoporphyrinogen oxidase
MQSIGIVYATREGQTKRIAEHLAANLRSRGYAVETHNLHAGAPADLSRYAAVILAASVHAGDHAAEMVKFVKQHRQELESLPSAFVSVTLSEAGAERPNASPEEHARFAADVQKVIDRFVEQTGWRPKCVKPVAGALQYSKYNILLRFVMKRIAREAGAETDTSRDYEYTDWTALDRFAGEFTREIRAA